MKRGAGFVAMLTVLLAGMRFVAVPAAYRPTAASRAETQAGVSRASVTDDATCPAFAAPAERTSSNEASEAGAISTRIDRFLYGNAQEKHLGGGVLPEAMRLMIVTVPDPSHTHLSLQFDRTLEALQQAAQDERFTYDSSWLPWRVSGSDKEADAQKPAHRDGCPGLILFRRNFNASTQENCTFRPGTLQQPGDAPFACGMLVFVVSEQPTSGLNRVQWENALAWLAAHSSKSRPDRALRVLGPTFSGSIPSYVRALAAVDRYRDIFSSTLLYTGRIRGCSSWRWLTLQLNRASPPPGVATPSVPVRLSDFEENDAVQTDRFYKYLVDRGHRLSEVAVLSEDETAYGGLPDAHSGTPECNPEYPYSGRPVHLYYPRDISAIRSAYQEQSIFSQSSKGEGGSTPHLVLRPDYDANAHEGTDTVQPFSGTNLALTQEAQLYGIVNTLKTHGIRYIVLRSTNSLDYLFLTRFLHRAYPSAYIVTIGSDLLFGREVDSTEFRGVIALSTFPLLPRGQDWTRQAMGVPQHAHRVFGSYTMEGAYLAGRFLISDPEMTPAEIAGNSRYVHPRDRHKIDIPDFAAPFWQTPFEAAGARKPATWLSVIGRDGYWPLATLTASLQAPRFSNLTAVERSQNETQTADGNMPPPERLTLPSSWRLFCVLGLLALGVHAFASRFGWAQQSLGMFVHFTPLKGWRAPALITAGWTGIACLLLTLLLTPLRIFQWLPQVDRIWVWAAGAGFILALLLSFLHIRWWRQAPPGIDDSDTRNWTWADRRSLRFSPLWLLGLLILVSTFAAALWASFDFGPSNEIGVPTAYRSVHLTGGVSPVVSLLMMASGFYWWFWQCLSGLALLGNGRPVLPRPNKVPPGFTQISDSIGEDIDQAATPLPWSGRNSLLLYLLPLFLVVLAAFVLQRPWMQAFDLVLHSLENEAFSRTLHALMSIGLYLILFECLQFYSTWLALKRLLEALNRLPLRRTFAAIQGLSMPSLWRLSGASSRARFKVFAHQLESLLHLRNELTCPENEGKYPPALRHEVDRAWQDGWKFTQQRSRRRDFAMVNDCEARDIRMRLSVCAETILRDLLVVEWQTERTSLDLRECGSAGYAGETMKLSETNAMRLGEEFLCLIYIGYLQNMLGRLRTMVLSMTGIFAAIALSLGFYPYTPRPTISLCLLFLLLLIGAVVGSVFAGLDRDSTLSHITNTTPGQLGAHFWLRMLSFIGVPAMGLLVTQFPEVTAFVFSWVEPTMNAMK